MIINKASGSAMLASTTVSVVAVVIASIAWVALWFGLALSVLWGWFVAPLFGVADIGVAQAYGLVLVVRALHAKAPTQEEAKRSIDDQLVRIIMLPPFVTGLLLGVGWGVSIWAR